MNTEFDVMAGVPQEEMETIEDYMVWRQHVGEMYSLFREKKLPVESLTFDWLPNDEAVIGNFEEGNSKLMVIKPEASIDTLWEYATEKEINRARVYLKDDTFIACISANGDVLVFNYTKKSEPLRLKAHEDNGFALSWSKSGLLATGDDSRKICIWKVDFAAWTFEKVAETQVEFKEPAGETQEATEAKTEVAGEVKAEGAGAEATEEAADETELKGINDLAWIGNQLVAGCDDGQIRIYDESLNLLNTVDSLQGTVDCLANNPFSDTMFATAGKNCTISLWNIREPSAPVHTMTGHDKTIASIKFSPQVDGLLASAGEDRRVIVWNICNIGTTQDPEEAEEALPEISFIHGGHVMMVNDLSWHPSRRWVLASVSEDKTAQIWKPNELVTDEAVIPDINPALLETRKAKNPFEEAAAKAEAEARAALAAEAEAAQAEAGAKAEDEPKEAAQ